MLLLAEAFGASDAVDYVAAKKNLADRLANEWLECTRLAGENAKLSTPINSEMRELLKALPDKPGKTTGELMNSEQADKFGRLSQRQHFFTGKMLFISKRERDIEVVDDVYEQIIGQFERGKAKLKYERSDEQKNALEGLMDFIGSMVMEKEEEITKVEWVNDSVDVAFGNLVRCVKDILITRWDKVKEYKAEWEKKRGTKFKADDLSEQEQRQYEDKLRKPLEVALNAHVRLIGLRVLYTLLTNENKWALEEFNASAGDLDAAGKRMNEFAKNASEEVRMMVGAVRVINDKFPCRWVRDMEMMQKSINSQTK